MSLTCTFADRTHRAHNETLIRTVLQRPHSRPHPPPACKAIWDVLEITLIPTSRLHRQAGRGPRGTPHFHVFPTHITRFSLDPFLVGGVICLVDSVNERDLNLLTSRTISERQPALPHRFNGLSCHPREGVGSPEWRRLLRGALSIAAEGGLRQ